MTNDPQAIFAQTDPRWNRQRIGNSTLTIKGWGCTITATCRALFLLTGKLLTPLEMEEKLNFLNDGRVLWQSYSNVGLKATRGYGKPKEFKKGMLIELNYNPRHWVAFEEMKDDNAIRVMDPLKAEIVTKLISDISGYTMVESAVPIKEPKLTDFEKDIVEAREWVVLHGISNGERRRDFITREEQWVMMKRLAERLMEWTK